ncbi:hypothetical protein ACN27F_23405 [Solwaraspora sp. WMMB335]|uniref:hypothetical protein n=1 Tax=Solwaraspora sp. WMMB335 TaxID=3404118 RepID=UPI003B956B5C
MSEGETAGNDNRGGRAGDSARTVGTDVDHDPRRALLDRAAQVVETHKADGKGRCQGCLTEREMAVAYPCGLWRWAVPMLETHGVEVWDDDSAPGGSAPGGSAPGGSAPGGSAADGDEDGTVRVFDGMVRGYFRILTEHADDPTLACCRICLRTCCQSYRRARSELVRLGVLTEET